jgi:hypothetical protein
MGSGRKRDAKIVASVISAFRWLSEKGERADAGEGCSKACVKSAAAAMAVSVDDAAGITRFVGNHASVSVMRSAAVAGR